MKRSFSKCSMAVALLAALLLASSGCPDGAPLDPPVNPGNRAPRIILTNVVTPNPDGSAEQGDTIRIDFNAEDSDDRAFVRIFASDSENPATGTTQFPILSNFPIGPGTGSGQAFWRTTTVNPGSYFIFGEIDDRTYDPVTNTGNPPVLVTYTQPVLVAPQGTGPENAPPELTVELPASDGGFTNGDTLTIRYTVRDPNSNVDNLTFTYFFDRDRNAANDASQPPLNMGGATVTSGSIPAGALAQFQAEIAIDLNLIPIRTETDEGGRPLPYFLRIRVDDGKGGVVNSYAPGAVRILQLPHDVIDLQQIGGNQAGAIFQGFDGAPDDPVRGSRAGAIIAPLGDLDLDGLDDFAIVAETASPFNAPRVGEVYVIYGRERRINLDLAQVLPFSSGRYAGSVSLNTVGSFVPFPPTDPRYQTIFNIRGTIIPQMPSITGETLGITSLVSIPNMSVFNPDFGAGNPETTRDMVIGWPFGVGPFDQEDDDPCDSCAYDEMEQTPFPCFNIVPRFAPNEMTSDVTFPVNNLPAGVWQPFDPENPIPFYPPNVDFDLSEGRIEFFQSLNIEITGTIPEGAEQNFTIDFQLETAEGPTLTVNITPLNFDQNGDQFTATVAFAAADLTLPVTPGESVPTSVYDGLFILFARPSAVVQELTVTVLAQGQVAVPGDDTAIKTVYGDGFPNPFPDGPTGSGANPLAIADLGVVCPPRNRSFNPITLPGRGNFDAHTCAEVLGLAVGCLGLSNDDLIGATYESGQVFVNAGDDIVMRLFTGVDANGDGVPDDGPAGVWRGDGFRVALQELFGQPAYLRQGGLGLRGGRFRGAWFNPIGVYDPRNLFGYTVDVIADMDTFGPTETELLVSAPGGGSFTGLVSDLTGALAASYSNDPSLGDVVTTAVSPFNLGVTFNNITSVILRISGSAANAAVIQVGLDNGAGGFIPGSVREALLWNGASPAPAEDAAPTLLPGDIEGDEVFFFALDLTYPRSVLQQFRSGTGTVRVRLRPDCAVNFSSMQIDSAQLLVSGLLSNTGFVHVFQGNDYASNAVENFNCGGIAPTNGDAEGDENRPMSWPSLHCPDGSDDTRVQCAPSEIVILGGERFQDHLGFAHNAGDVNLDGVVDFVCGAPGSDNDPFTTDLNCNFANEPNPLTNNGKTYLIYGTPTLGSGRPCDLPERLEVRGSHNDDQFGRVQGLAGDVNGDSTDDLFVGAEGYDADNLIGLSGAARVDAGFVGVLFGRRVDQNAALSIRPEQIGTPNFPGVKFIGGVPGAKLSGGTTGNTNIFAGSRGQHGVSGAGDFNRDGIGDLLITAPGQPWPSIKIEFKGNVADGDTVTINAGVAPTVFEFDLNGSVTPGRNRVAITSADPLSAQQALVSAMTVLAAESLGVSAITSRTNFPSPLPDTPTVTFLRRQYSPATGWVISSNPNVVVTEFVRQGVAYLIFGSDSLLLNKTFELPQDINRRDINGNRVLKGMVLISAFEKNTGGGDPTPDEAPIDAVATVGDIDGDGFVDIMVGAPQADLINVIAPNERRQAAGEAYLIYGNEFGFNRGTLP